MTEFKELMALSKGFKIFFAVLSVVALAGLLGAFALQSWAKDKIQHGEFVLNGTDKGWQERLESSFAYDIVGFILKRRIFCSAQRLSRIST